jgi:peroxiredoxin
MRLLRDRGGDLAQAGIRIYAISLDQPWSQQAWAQSLAAENVHFLSDRLGETATAFGVIGDFARLPRAERSAFLVAGDTVKASWRLGREMPDVDAIIASATR